jgi:hypothetical protein
MAGNRDTAWLGWVLLLPMTASRDNQVPTIVLNQLDILTDLHCHPVVAFDQHSQDNYYSCRKKVYHHSGKTAKDPSPRHDCAA